MLVPGRPPSPCIVRNYTRATATLDLTELLDPPYQIQLRVGDCTEEIPCEVRNVRDYRMGIRFVSQDFIEIVARAFDKRAKARDVPTEAETRPLKRVTGSELREKVLGLSVSRG